MEVETLRNRLHDYINNAQENKLQAIYTLVQEDIEHYDFSEEDIKVLNERRERHIKGESKSYTVAESIAKIKENKL